MATLIPDLNYLSLDEFMALPSAPCQRDTERHALKASARHLHEPHPRNASVAIASLKISGGDVFFKIDGHTRAYLWDLWKSSDGKSGLEPVSSLLKVEAYACSDLEDLIHLYRTFDAPSAAEDSADLVAGAFRLADFHPRSPLLRNAKVSTAARMAVAALRGLNSISQIDTQEAVGRLIEEFRVIDEIRLYPSLPDNDQRLSPEKIRSGHIAGVLLALHKMPHETDHIVRFTRNFATRQGLSIPDQGRDAVMALIMIMDRGKDRGSNGQWITMERTLNAILTWKDGVADRTEQGIDPRDAVKWAAQSTHKLVRTRKYKNRFMKEQEKLEQESLDI